MPDEPPCRILIKPEGGLFRSYLQGLDLVKVLPYSCQFLENGMSFGFDAPESQVCLYIRVSR